MHKKITVRASKPRHHEKRFALALRKLQSSDGVRRQTIIVDLLRHRSVHDAVRCTICRLPSDGAPFRPVLGNSFDRTVREIAGSDKLPERVVRLQSRGPGTHFPSYIIPVRRKIIVERLAATERSVAPVPELLRCRDDRRLARLSDMVVKVEDPSHIGPQAAHETASAGPRSVASTAAARSNTDTQRDKEGRTKTHIDTQTRLTCFDWEHTPRSGSKLW